MASSVNIRIPARFNGPDKHANGGYLCGLLAEHTPWLAEFTLRKMIPVERDLKWTVDGEHAYLAEEKVSYVTARKGALADIPVPDNPGLLAAKEAGLVARASRSVENYPNCYVCGPSRADGEGMRIHAGKIGNSPHEIYATNWTPAVYMSGDSAGLVHNRFTYAALDCPGAEAAKLSEDETVLLGRFTVEVTHPVSVGQEYVIIAWCSKREGRKRFSHTAIYDADSKLMAKADAVWFQVGTEISEKPNKQLP